VKYLHVALLGFILWRGESSS